MSAIRDFEAQPQPQTRHRSDTAATTGTLGAPPMSPIARSHTSHHSHFAHGRRSSNGSHLSAPSPTGDGMRFRHPSRSNTVTTYHEADSKEPALRPGAEPGIDTSAEETALPDHLKNLKAECEINIIDYSPDPNVNPRRMEANNQNLAKILEEGRPDEYSCRWISVNGLSWDVIKCLGNTYNLHRLAIEDIVHNRTRTKVDWYTDHACIILTLQKLVMLHQHAHDDDCDCLKATEEMNDEKPHHYKRKKWWQKIPTWRRKPIPKRKSHLPYYLDTDDDGKIDEFVHAHSGLSHESPITAVRTLHRYESSDIPEHTAFMEKHSTLAPEELAVAVEQVSIFLLSNNTVISFFEMSAQDVETPIRDRIYSAETILRRSSDASLLLQAIIDAIVDLAVPVRDAYNKARKELQVDAMISPNIRTSRALHIFGEEIDMLQNLIKPIVHLVNALRDHNSEGPVNAHTTPSSPSVVVSSPPPLDDDDSHPRSTKHEPTKRDREGAPTFHRKISAISRPVGAAKRLVSATSVSITPLAHTYFGDVLDHLITMIQAMEQMDASASNISTLIFNTVGARTNNFMMILAIVTVFFAPLTFISGYFGQNFANGKGLDHPFSFFWVVSIPVLVAFMALVFATMLWDSIKDWFSKRGIRSHRHRRNKIRRMKGYYA